MVRITELWDLVGSTDAHSVGFQGLASAFLHLQLFLPLSQNTRGGGAFFLELGVILQEVGVEAVFIVAAMPISG